MEELDGGLAVEVVEGFPSVVLFGVALPLDEDFDLLLVEIRVPDLFDVLDFLDVVELVGGGVGRLGFVWRGWDFCLHNII